MSAIPDLWPDDISAEARSPLAILRAQEAALAHKTGGLVEAKVTTAGAQHRLELYAPQLRRRVPVCAVVQPADRPYPARIEAGDLAADPAGPADAHSEEEFIERLGRLLRSPGVRSVIDSLIALSNERGEAGEAADGDDPGGGPGEQGE